MKTRIGVDNGISGTIGIINENETIFIPTPIKSEQSYTKKKQNISRIKFQTLYNILKPYSENCHVMLERPMINSTRFKASMSSIRALEATVIVLEILRVPFEYLDSKLWQNELLPKGVKGTPELKKASMDIGKRLFPQFEDFIVKHGDADGILIAEYCRRHR